MTDEEKEIIEAQGWSVDCESPLSISHPDGSYAVGLAAEYAIDGIVEDSKDEIRNQDIIDFRYKLIDYACSKSYDVTGWVCNDNYTNIMTEERKKVLMDVLSEFNTHFRMRNYNIS